MEAVEGAEACHDGTPEVRGRFRVRVDAPGFSNTLRGWLGMRHPGSLRAEILDPFGRPAFVLVVDGGEMRVLDQRDGTFTVGSATAQNLARFVGIPLDPGWAVRILSGQFLSGTEVDYEKAGEDGTLVARVEEPGTGVTCHAEVSPDPLAVTTARCYVDDVKLWDVAYGEWDRHGDCGFPRSIRLALFAPDVILDLTYTSLDRDTPLPADFFTLREPEGVRRVTLP